MAEDQQGEEEAGAGFGTFAGVFTPTVLTILGVIMYLRTGWVVGNAGTRRHPASSSASRSSSSGATSLSIASITTNIRIGAGGAYSIISQSLGLEIGGAVGLPLFAAQALVVVLYIFGFRDGWLLIFPDHPAILVDLAAFAVLAILAYTSAGLTFRIQYVIMAAIAFSLVMVAASVFTGALDEPLTWVGRYPGAPETGFEGTSFWPVFAVFFPAATGILAGVNLSGDLADPRRSIPVGVLSAVAVGFVVYTALAVYFALAASPTELVQDYNILVDLALWGPAVLVGLLGATFSSALASMVGAPRILQAIAEHGIIPRGSFLARKVGGEPRNALLVTGVLVLAGLMLRDLNAIAALLTMFFLITYGMINLVLLLEQGLGLLSFRPGFRIPAVVPLVGALGCLGVMAVVNPIFSLLGVVVVALVWFYLGRRGIRPPYSDLRNGLLLRLSQWAAERITRPKGRYERSWRPHLLVPVEDPAALVDHLSLVRALGQPRGHVNLIGICAPETGDGLRSDLAQLAEDLGQDHVYTSTAVVEAEGFERGVVATMQALQSSFSIPNVVLLTLPGAEEPLAGPEVDDDRAPDEDGSADQALRTDHRAHRAARARRRPSRRQCPGRPGRTADRPVRRTRRLGLGDHRGPVELRPRGPGGLHRGAGVGDETGVRRADRRRVRARRRRTLPRRLRPSGADAGLGDHPRAHQRRGGGLAACRGPALHVFRLDAEPNLRRLRAREQEVDGPCLFVNDAGYESALA